MSLICATDMDNCQMVEWIQKGNRMPQESDVEDLCYSIMTECWDKTPSNRPSFHQLQHKLTYYIEDVKRRNENTAFQLECVESYPIDF